MINWLNIEVIKIFVCVFLFEWKFWINVILIIVIKDVYKIICLIYCFFSCVNFVFWLVCLFIFILKYFDFFIIKGVIVCSEMIVILIKI